MWYITYLFVFELFVSFPVLCLSGLETNTIAGSTSTLFFSCFSCFSKFGLGAFINFCCSFFAFKSIYFSRALACDIAFC